MKRENLWQTLFAVQFGAGNLGAETTGDNDGEDRTDISYLNQSTATFWVKSISKDSVVSTQLGQNGDFPKAIYDKH